MIFSCEEESTRGRLTKLPLFLCFEICNIVVCFFHKSAICRKDLKTLLWCLQRIQRKRSVKGEGASTGPRERQALMRIQDQNKEVDK
jgi:hypothetical protein